MRILLADAHSDVRTALRLALDQQEQGWIVEESPDVLSLFAQVSRDCPDILLLDPNLPGMPVRNRTVASHLVELVDTLRRLCPTLFIVALSSRPEDQRDCEEACIDQFILKSDPPGALLAWLGQFEALKRSV